MVRSENEAHDMRHNQADVADGAAHGDCQSGQHRRGNVNDQPHARHVHAKMHSLFFPGEEHIQIRRGGVDRPGGQQEPDAQEPIGAFLQGRGEITHQPER